MSGGGLPPISVFADPDYQHYVANQELYWVSKHLADIKYLGASHKTIPPTYSMVVCAANLYWANFFNELRRYLQWPIEGSREDYVAQSLTKTLHPSAERFLRNL